MTTNRTKLELFSNNPDRKASFTNELFHAVKTAKSIKGKERSVNRALSLMALPSDQIRQTRLSKKEKTDITTAIKSLYAFVNSIPEEE